MITDRNGHILARSVECCSVYANPSIITDIEATATALAGVLGRPVDQIKPLLEKKRSFVWIARRVDDATAEAIRQADLTGVELRIRAYLPLPSGGWPVARFRRYGRQGA